MVIATNAKILCKSKYFPL